jgi:uncharacterized membrane protein
MAACARFEENLPVSVLIDRRYAAVIHPLHAVLLAGTVPLYLGAALSDLAYANTYQIQWSNFASWLLAGSLVLNALALIFLLADLFRVDRRVRGILPYAVTMVAAWAVGFIDALVHARDAWASMPAGLVLSIAAALLACIGTWFGFRGRGHGAVA